MTVRVGVIGAGMIGQDHIRRLTGVVTGAAVTAVADVDAERAAEVAARVGATTLPAGADLVASPVVDAVLVTSWGPAHAEHVLNAIAAGKPVFCEKPLAPRHEDCLRIVAAERAYGRRLVQVGFMRRFDAGYRQMKEVLSTDSLGAPLIVHCTHRNPTVPESYHSAMAAHDTAVHEIDVLRWLLDDEIVSAQVVTRHPVRGRRRGRPGPAARPGRGRDPHGRPARHGRADFMPFFLHPRADDARVQELKQSLRTHGVRLSSVLPPYKWSSPDETERQAAVRYWNRMIEITADLECPLMNSEFNGRPERAAESGAAFRRSLEELLSLFEREGIALNLEAHPDGFCEENTPAVDLDALRR